MPTFLQPMFLAGLAALAIPVLIHFFFRLRARRVELGTIRFLRVAIENHARRRKLLRWLLLALRMGFVALLVILFTRPYFPEVQTDVRQEHLIILIDQSATMQLKGDDGRLIDQAVDQAKQLIQSAGARTQIEIAFFDHDIHPFTNSTKNDALTRGELLAKLQAPKSTFGATNFGTVFAWARDICLKAPEGVKKLHLFTDLQRSGLDWTGVEPLPVDVKPHLHDLGRPAVNNVAVTNVMTPRPWARPNESPMIHASVVNMGATALNDVPVLFEFGQVPDDRSVASPDRSKSARSAIRTDFAKLSRRFSKRELVKVEPGAAISFDYQVPSLTEGLWQGRVVVEYEDDLSFDNQRFVAISATPAYQILVVNGEAAESPFSRETYFVEAALNLAIDDDLYPESPFAPTSVSYSPAAGLPDLNQFDAIVLANVSNISTSSAAQLASFVRGGGGLLVFTGDNVTERNCVNLAREELTVGEIGDKNVSIDLPWRLSQWETKHAICEPLSDPQHGDLRRLLFAAYTKLTPFPETKVLAQFDTTDPAVLERRVGEGIVLWIATSCGRDWSNWYRSRLFLPIIHQLLSYEVGLTSGGRVRTRLIDADHSSKVELKAKTSAGSIPGVDRFDGFVEVVNTSPRESETERCSQQEFEEHFAVKFVDDVGNEAIQVTGLDNVDIRQDELWQWVGCLLLAVMLLEGFIGNRTTV